ncbi:hypothetical protein M0R45_030393 [Rubus argutus]|uniref:Uncharacterized protein n=1 Tax=Rubus argutus TaxID=59490 RepID=A0AAW1WEY1_RUBAR
MCSEFHALKPTAEHLCSAQRNRAPFTFSRELPSLTSHCCKAQFRPSSITTATPRRHESHQTKRPESLSLPSQARASSALTAAALTARLCSPLKPT